MSAAIVRHPGEFRWETRLLGVVTLILTVIGIASCYATGTYKQDWFNEATRQSVAALIGGALFIIVARIDYRWWRTVALPLFLATLAGLVVIAVIAVLYHKRKGPAAVNQFFPYKGGAHRWIKLGAQIQFAEIARFTLVVWLATHAASLANKVRDFNEGFIPLMGTIALTCGLIAIEPSVTMATALGVIGVAVIFTAGARVPHLAMTVFAAAAMIVLVLKFDSVRNKRNLAFQGSALECVVDDQACQALIGFGRGHIVGVGFGNGTQKLGATAEAYSDYLLSVVGEEWGIVGVGFVALCFVTFCWMGFRIARTAPDPFGTYLASGLTVAVGVTAFMHAAVVTWLMPSTGLTLPFMSVGRVSLLLYLVSAGVIVSIGRQRGKPARAK